MTTVGIGCMIPGMNTHKPQTLMVALVLVFWALAPNAGRGQAEDLIDAALGLLDLKGVPSGSEDWEFAPLSDQGAWFGFALPADDRPGFRGGFTGPFLMPSGTWLGPQLGGLYISEAGTGEIISWGDASSHKATVYPGSLRRRTEIKGLIVNQWLWFDSARTAVLLTRVGNPGEEERRLHLTWKGEVFQGVVLDTLGAGILATSPDSSVVHILADSLLGKVSVSGLEYEMDLAGPTVLAPGQAVSVALFMTHALPGDELESPVEVLGNPALSLRSNLARWNGYLKAVDTGGTPDSPEQILVAKSVMTLVNNWRAPAGRMRFSCLFPSSNVWYFNGFWAWDSWKHAVGILEFDPELAKEQVRAMFAHQDDRGMIADVVYLDAGEDNWRNTKPPLAGWAVQTIFEATGDLDFVAEILPRLVAYHGFWYADRDHDGDGLCEYGSTDGTIIAARWESGMDNAVRFDDTEMLANGPGAWSMDQESVDLNAYLYREKMALAVMAEAVGEPGEAARWREDAAALKSRIRKEMFDERSGWFYDIAIDGSAIIPVQGPEGWIPLWAGVASADQADRVRDTMLDPDRFNTHVPFPTVAADHPEFSDGYWRGSVWLDQVYFAIEGLREYGYGKDADQLSFNAIRHAEGAAIPGAPLRENYHPLTGAGQNVRHFSWTAAHFLLLVSGLEP